MEKQIWDFLKKEGFNDYAVAGLMGNLYAESGLNPKNLENIYNTKLDYSDEEYTRAVDDGSYENFVNDSAGYGLAQWTYYTRKRNLYNFAKNMNCSIGNLEMQLNFLINELKNNYTNSVYKVLLNASSLQQASDIVLYKFENPANAQAQSAIRLSYSQNFYNKYAKGVVKRMGIQTFARGENVQLSDNFNSSEFECQCGRCSTVKIDMKLVDYLQELREYFGKPININSGYRCASHNAAVGGARGSKHATGEAVDLQFVEEPVPAAEVAKKAETMGIKGIGLYEKNGENFVHIDTRTYKAFWYGHEQSPRSTFGGGAPMVSSPANTNPITTLRYGSNGAEVKELQEDLIALGYDLGIWGADGDYGNATVNAVKKFQQKEDLKVDGIAGPVTLTALDKAVAAIQKIENIQQQKDTKVKITASGLNVRQGASRAYPIIGIVYKNSIHKIVDIDGEWGEIENPRGWINLSYTEQV